MLFLLLPTTPSEQSHPILYSRVGIFLVEFEQFKTFFFNLSSEPNGYYIINNSNFLEILKENGKSFESDVFTSSKAESCCLVRLAAADREDAVAGSLAATSFFPSSRGLSTDSSTVASVGEEKKANGGSIHA